MGIPTSDGPDFIVNQLRSDVTFPWSRPLAAAIAGAWLLFVLVPYLFGEYAAATLVRWSVIALVALGLNFAIPALMGRERPRAAIGTAVGAAALVALAWVATAG
jgi:VIT1/CCC1 family predicted Fe2+/Mn2+ transporter